MELLTEHNVRIKYPVQYAWINMIIDNVLNIRWLNNNNCDQGKHYDNKKHMMCIEILK